MRLQLEEHWVFNAEEMEWPSTYPSISSDDIERTAPALSRRASLPISSSSTGT